MCNLYLVSPEIVENSVGLDIPFKGLWSVGEMANVSWFPSSLIVERLTSTTDVKVDILLRKYNSNNDSLDETVVLATDLPNSGSATVVLPLSLKSNLAHSEYDFHTAVVAIAVNTSTTNFARSKRAYETTFIFSLATLYAFGKPMTVFLNEEDYVKMRIECEKWVQRTPPFPTRRIPPCPCNDTDAERDDRFVVEDTPDSLRLFFHPHSKRCYRQANVRQVGWL